MCVSSPALEPARTAGRCRLSLAMRRALLLRTARLDGWRRESTRWRGNLRFSSLKLPFVRRIKSSSASQRSNIIISCIVRHVHRRISASAARATPQSPLTGLSGNHTVTALDRRLAWRRVGNDATTRMPPRERIGSRGLSRRNARRRRSRWRAAGSSAAAAPKTPSRGRPSARAKATR